MGLLVMAGLTRLPAAAAVAGVAGLGRLGQRACSLCNRFSSLRDQPERIPQVAIPKSKSGPISFPEA